MRFFLARIFLLFVSLSLVLGCSITTSRGKKIDQNNSLKVREGVTTKKEVLAWLGNPQMISFTPDVKEIWRYYYVKEKIIIKPSYFIPIFGLIAYDFDQWNYSPLVRQNFEVLIGDDGKVEKITK